MNLVAFSIKTKGLRNFMRRLRTVFSRFGFTGVPMHRSLSTILELLNQYGGSPTFFIPAVVLRRHPALLAEIADCGAEVGIHGFVHNNYRLLSKHEQYKQTQRAIAVFEQLQRPFLGVRNPYLGWKEDTVEVYTSLGFAYESNEAVFHDIVPLDHFSRSLQESYAKSQELYQVLPCNAYTLRPHFEGDLVRIPLSVPDDEMLFDRLHITSVEKIGHLWSAIMLRVYDFSGIYTLNLHPERAALCAKSLAMLASCARSQNRPVWIARLGEVAHWWKERRTFKLHITRLADNCWQIEPECTSEAALLARHVPLAGGLAARPWRQDEVHVSAQRLLVHAQKCPCIALSRRTPQSVADFLSEQGCPYVFCDAEQAEDYVLSLDMPAGLGTTRGEQVQLRSDLVAQIEQLDAPFVRFSYWPGEYYAALAISGDIDSITIQDFFLRIFEAQQYA